MLSRLPLWSALLATVLTVGTLGAAGCAPDNKKTERWATTENTNVKIDWDKVNEAYKAAEGPADLEKRINEIYEGDEIISISVVDTDAKTQVVTGFFDKDTNGQVGEGEKIFSIQRVLSGEGQAQAQLTGYGPYAGYVSPFWGIASGMMLGAMMSNMFMPSYVPMYGQPYVTSAARAGELTSQRAGYRASNPDRFSKPSRTGRTYGGGAGGSAPARSRGGSRFGVRRGRRAQPVLLLA